MMAAGDVDGARIVVDCGKRRERLEAILGV